MVVDTWHKIGIKVVNIRVDLAKQLNATASAGDVTYKSIPTVNPQGCRLLDEREDDGAEKDNSFFGISYRIDPLPLCL